MAVKPIPDGYHSVTPYLVVQGAAKLIEFLKKAFGAEEVFPPMKGPDGAIMHAELRIGDSIVMMGDAGSGGQFAPTQSMIHLYVNDADAFYKSALQRGREGPVRQLLVDRHAQGRCVAGGIGAARSSAEEAVSDEWLAN